MMRILLLLAANLSLAVTAEASVVLPVTLGVWDSQKVLPLALESGDFSRVRGLLDPRSIIVSDDERILATGPDEIGRYLEHWYAKGNHVTDVYPGYASMIILVTRKASRDWEKAYAMIVTCRDEKITRIMMVKRNPSIK